MTTSFSLFPELPVELQRLIWDAAVSNIEPRTVHLRYRRLTQHHSHRVWSSKSIDDTSFLTAHADPGFPPAGILPVQEHLRREYGLSCPSPPPVLLGVCKECYEAVTRSYVRAFGAALSSPETWINFNKDILYMECCTAKLAHDVAVHGSTVPLRFSAFNARDFSRIKIIALRFGANGRENLSWSISVLLKGVFPGVERLIFSDRQHDAHKHLDVVGMNEIVHEVPKAILRYQGKSDCCQLDVEELQSSLNRDHLNGLDCRGQRDEIATHMHQYFEEMGLPVLKAPSIEHMTFVERKMKDEYDKAKKEYPEKRLSISQNCGKGCTCPPSEEQIKVLLAKFQGVLVDIRGRGSCAGGD